MSEKRKHIQHYHSQTKGAKPTPGSLYLGELSVNTADENIMFKNNSDKIVEITSKEHIYNNTKLKPNNNQIFYTSTDGNIVVPTNTTNIISNVYENGKGIITFSEDIIELDEGFFAEKTTLETVVLPDSITIINGNAFEMCTHLKKVNIPDSVTTIGDYAFYGCSSLTSVTIPDSVEEIGEWAFYQCSNLTSVTIGKGVTFWGLHVFAGCKGELIINSNIPSVLSPEDSPFYSSKFTKVTIGNSVTTIGEWAFVECTSLTSVTIGDSVTTIGNGAFQYCDSLTSVTIGNSVKTIGNSAFSGCDSLTSVTIPDSVTTIGNEAFYDCKSLKTVYCKPITPPTVVGAQTFDASTSIYVNNISYNEYLTEWTSLNNKIYPFGNEEIVKITHSNLLKIVNEKKCLIPGQQYRITDYVTTTIQENTQSAGHQFDIIVTADNESTLNEVARAAIHDGDTYFTENGANLDAWEIKYALDNDTERFYWADATNGKGVIYYMKDEWNNECPYDFKNIMFLRDITVNADTGASTIAPKSDITQEVYCYTFSYRQTDGVMLDTSIYANNGTVTMGDSATDVSSNKMNILDTTGLGNLPGINTDLIDYSLKQYFLNHIVFFVGGNMFYGFIIDNIFGAYCHNMTFGNICASNSFGTSCFNNTFGVYCLGNSFGSSCSNNTFGNNCIENSFGADCGNNTFGAGCTLNSFGNNFDSNSFGDGCLGNSFGNNCRNNSFGYGCESNSFGNECWYNSFRNSASKTGALKDYVRYNHFDDGCSYNVIWNSDTTSSSIWLKNINVNRGVSGTNDLYNFINVNSLNSEKEININNYDEYIYIDYGDIFKVTYDTLVTLRDNSQLIPGRQYRIIDYVTTTSQANTQSAGHQFDIIVTADDESTLNEAARAIQHDGDTYFTENGANLDVWQIWYCLDNDMTRFNWADATNGKGVIYRMIDEFNNDCPYDFKNIKFKHPKNTTTYPDYYYTFSTVISGVVTDHSMLRGYCYNNTMKECIRGETQSLNINVFINTSKTNSCYSNSFGNGCSSNSFGLECYSNSFGDNCNGNSFGNGCYYNTFGNDCYSNTFGVYCLGNSFGNHCRNFYLGISCFANSFGNYCVSNSLSSNCHFNSFGNGCSSNSFGSYCVANFFGNNCNNNSFAGYCQSNSFGNECLNNSFGSYCSNNTFGSGCYYNSFRNSASQTGALKSYCTYNHFDDGCSYNVIWNSSTTSSSIRLKNININRGVVGIRSSYNFINVNLLNSEQEININNYNGHIYIDYGDIFKITYSELVTLRDNSQLIPGRQYRIIDYVTTTIQENTQSAGHQFDVIVTATDESTLSENARAAIHDGDTYFTENGANLDAWKIWYSLDNDNDKFAWADVTNGKGVIYRMIDEFGNDSPYDFKNIQFKRKLTAGALNNENGVDTWCYTFNAYCTDDKNIYDASVIVRKELINDDANRCYGNIIKEYCESVNNVGSKLNDIVFLNKYGTIKNIYFHCYSNLFGNNCQSNSFGNSCSNNSFGNDCYSNSFGDECQSNSFGNYCGNNSFGNICIHNTFGDRCLNNSFGDSFISNLFGHYCQHNSFGNWCTHNSFGNNCQYNSIRNSASETGTLKEYCEYNHFDDGCKYNIIWNSTITNRKVQLKNINVNRGVVGTADSYNTINIDVLNQDYEIQVAKNSNGEIKIYCEADLIL